MMQAVIARAYGAPADFALETVAAPQPAEGEVRIAVAACGVSFLDALVAAGRYQIKPPLPFSPGSEFSGVIESIGSGVREYSKGDRVCASAVYGGYAEYVCVPAAAVHRIPDTMDFPQAAVFGVSFATAYHALVQRGSLQAGETLFVLGASGSVGLTAVQVGRMLGARVIAGASTPMKRQRTLDAGADAAIDTSLADWRTPLKTTAGAAGIDVVLDPVGGAASEPAFRSLNWNGRHLVVGFASGNIASLPLNLPLVKSAALIGVELRSFNERDPATAATNFSRLIEGYEQGILRADVAGTLPLEAFATAMNHSATGRMVLKPTSTDRSPDDAPADSLGRRFQ